MPFVITYLYNALYELTQKATTELENREELQHTTGLCNSSKTTSLFGVSSIQWLYHSAWFFVKSHRKHWTLGDKTCWDTGDSIRLERANTHVGHDVWHPTGRARNTPLSFTCRGRLYSSFRQSYPIAVRAVDRQFYWQRNYPPKNKIPWVGYFARNTQPHCKIPLRP